MNFLFKKIALLILFIGVNTYCFAGAMGNMGGGMGGNMGGMGGMGMGMGGPGVPINNGLVFLLIAGLLFGAKQVYDLSKRNKIVK